MPTRRGFLAGLLGSLPAVGLLSKLAPAARPAFQKIPVRAGATARLSPYSEVLKALYAEPVIEELGSNSTLYERLKAQGKVGLIR